jgi:hypothetical protein
MKKIKYYSIAMLFVAFLMCVKNDFTLLYFGYVFLFLIPHIIGFLIIDLMLVLLSTYLKSKNIYFHSRNIIYALCFIISIIGLGLFSLLDLYSNEYSNNLSIERYFSYFKKYLYPVAVYNIIFIIVNFYISKNPNRSL